MTRRDLQPGAIALVGTAIVTRFADLGSRFPHHDESIHAWMAHEIVRGAGYHYDPVYHGPLLYHLEAFVFRIIGEGNFQARVVPAAFGVALIALLCILLRPHLGRQAALIAGALAVLSPSLTYYSRFNIHDALIAAFTVVLVAAPFDYRRTGLMAFGGALGLAIATKLNTYFVLATLALYLLCREAYRRFNGQPPQVAEFYRRNKGHLMLAAGLAALLIALLSLTTFVYNVRATHSLGSAFATTLDSMLSGGFRYWWAMHRTPRLAGPFHFYLPLLFIYEPMIFFGAPAALLFYMRRRTSFAAALLALLAVEWLFIFHSPVSPTFEPGSSIQGWHLLLASAWLLAGAWAVVSLWSQQREFLACWVFFGVVQFLLYSYANEKVPWLVVHIVLPWIVVVGMLLSDLWAAARGVGARVALVVVVIAIEAFTARTSWIVNTRNRSNVSEPLLQLNYGPAVADTAREVLGLARSSGGRTTVAIEPPVQWPFGWYFRDVTVNYVPGHVGPEATEDVLITEDRDLPSPLADRYTGSRPDYSRWSWWINEVNNGDLRGMLRFMLRHDHWGVEDRAGFGVWRKKS